MNHLRINPSHLMFTIFLSMFIGLLLPLASHATAASEKQPFLRYPDLSDDHIVFSSAGDIWIANRDGSSAQRLTSHEGLEDLPSFSPDGKWIAFTGDYYGNADIYVIPVTGGEPKQLTFHPSVDFVVGWSPDGKVVFRTRRDAPRHAYRLYTVDPEGKFPEPMPLKRGGIVSFEPDGNQIVFSHTFLGHHPWKRYQGGYAEQLWVGTPHPKKPEFNRLFDYPGNQSWPMWHADGRVYFVCDSTVNGNFRGNIWSITPGKNDARRETDMADFDVRWPKMHNNDIIFQHGMDLYIFNTKDKQTKKLTVQAPMDFYVARTKFVKPFSYLTSWDLSHDGKRIVAAARGELFTLPVKSKGLIRQWTYSSGSREKYPVFLPESDGTVLAWSDISGEERLVSYNKSGAQPVEIENSPVNGWKGRIVPSPDGVFLAYGDYKHQLHIVEMSTGETSLVDTGEWEFYDYAWSPDSRYLAYDKSESNGINTLNIYDTKSKKSHLISDPHFSSFSPSWDPNGKYLYCLTRRNFNPYQDYDRALFYYDNQVTAALFLLQEDLTSPFIARGDSPESGSIPEPAWLKKAEKSKKDKDDDDEGVTPVVIDFDGLSDRCIGIPDVKGNLFGLIAVKNKFYYMSYQASGIFSGSDNPNDPGRVLHLYDLAKRSSSEILSGIGTYTISSDMSTIVVRKGNSWYHGSAGSDNISTDAKHTISVSDWQIETTPREEWTQILREAWRGQRDFFYDPGMHGVPWADLYRKYSSLIDRITNRDDLRDLIREIQGELHSGHAYTWGGDDPQPKTAPVGLLGVELKAHKNGRYLITRIYHPEPGTPGTSSPLVLSDPATTAGKTYILAINGRDVTTEENIYRYLQNLAGKEVALTLNEKPSLSGSREVIVKTLRSERYIKYIDWVRSNREYVQKASGGKVGYVHLPDMGGNGLSQFGRDYYPQKRLQGLIIDDRFNGGGNVSEYIIKELMVKPFAFQSARHGAIETKPHGAFNGHLAVLINGETMSDGETLAHVAATNDFAKCIGERTWGGWVWIWTRHRFVDNGNLAEPEFGGWGFSSQWLIEGPGVSPEMEVINDPASEMMGKDKQLDTAIDYLMNQIKADSRTIPKRPKGPTK